MATTTSTTTTTTTTTTAPPSGGSNTFNSVSAILDTTMEIQAQVLSALTSITQSLTTATETVQVSFSSNGTEIDFEIPSFGFIKSEIKRIDQNIQQLTGFTTGQTNLRLPDGTYQKIYTADAVTSPSDLTALPVPSSFGVKNNWFFENFLNPLLFVSFDVSSQIDNDTVQVMKERVIIKDDVSASSLFFDTYLKGKNDVDYNSLFTLLQANGVSWFLDDEILDLPVNTLLYSGDFDVIGISDQVVPVTINGTTIQSKVRYYTLASLTYTDNTDILKNTQTLKVGDQVISGTTSIYQVASVITSTNQVSFTKVSGYESIKIGAASISIYSDANPARTIQVNIGHAERQIIFFKPINRVTNLSSLDWSPGVAFFSSDLVDPTGSTDLDNYYQQVVTDFGQYFLSIAKEDIIPSVLGLIPNAPTIDTTNFQVVQVNTTQINTTTSQNILNLASQKASLESGLTALDTSIAQAKQQLGNTNFTDATERNTIQNTLDTLINQKTSQSNLYSSVVQQLITIGQASPDSLAAPVYHVRGFWAMPTPQTLDSTGDQQVIQFIVNYQYVTSDGNTGGVDQIDFIDANGEKKRAYFSNWIELKSDICTKTYNTTTGRYEWDNEDVTDPDVVNINQLDIPISPNQSVQIRIKSVSEAGWPLNPMVSDWSEIVVVPFPSNLSTAAQASAALQDALSEQYLIKFENSLNSMGLSQHLEDSIVVGDQYIAHNANNLASGFFDNNNNIISLFDQLTNMNAQIASLQALITNAKGTLEIYVIDSSGNQTVISNNTTIDIFAGYYQDAISSMAISDQKGAIITKVFYLGLSNSAASTLELISIYPGAVGNLIPSSATSGDSFAQFAYDKAAFILNGNNGVFSLSTPNQPSPYQSSQVLSQYMYVRGKDLSLQNNLFDTPATGTTWIEPLSVGIDPTAAYPYVWSGSSNAGNGVLSEFSIHTDHPLVVSGTSLASLQDPYTTSNQVYPAFRQSAFFNLQSSDPNGLKQLQNTPSDGLSDRGKYPGKLGFYANDRYLIGDLTCGSYLFLAPNKYTDIQINGTTAAATQSVEFGSTNMIKIPVVFQYRMCDYFGADPTQQGKVGGWNPSGTYPQNLTYSKKLGFDIAIQGGTTFSFDVQVTSKYVQDTLSQFNVSGGTSTTIVI